MTTTIVQVIQGVTFVSPSFTKKNQIPKMEGFLKNLICGLFWGVGNFPYIKPNIHTAYIGFRIPPFYVPEMFGEVIPIFLHGWDMVGWCFFELNFLEKIRHVSKLFF